MKSMFSDVTPNDDNVKEKKKSPIKLKKEKPKRNPKPEKKKKNSSIKFKKKSTEKNVKNSSKSDTEVFRVYSYFRNEIFKPDDIQVGVSKYLGNSIKLVNRKNSPAAVVLHRSGDLMSTIDDMLMDLEFNLSDDLIEDSESYVNTSEGAISVL